MTLIDLIKHVGQENVRIQPLNGSMTKTSTTKRGKGINTVTFKTTVTTNEIASDTVRGLILWIPSDKCPKSAPPSKGAQQG